MEVLLEDVEIRYISDGVKAVHGPTGVSAISNTAISAVEKLRRKLEEY